MSTIWITLGIVGILYGVPRAFRTFEREMRDDNKLWLFVGCLGILAFIGLTKVLA
jgi:hypothetical protein